MLLLQEDPEALWAGFQQALPGQSPCHQMALRAAVQRFLQAEQCQTFEGLGQTLEIVGIFGWGVKSQTFEGSGQSLEIEGLY
ncbi:MAG: hypothetical protein KA099_06905 [Alphaproteobacteria bacterium]|nr:hypothetical protein [Alphaproteobacteria bacterium]MBP7759712.1 hypothetical protein [Alphaproteobacteria bacterium]MBP7762839.1 hypothetical protein [Alphaproteobacteria bacterium]MBP7905038.1 hypothetical protein [Alphaproteobacteria bacterium]